MPEAALAGQPCPVQQAALVLTHKTGALLAYLAYHPGRSHPREILIDLLWPQASPESGRHNLSLALSSLRNQLEAPGVPAGSVIVADRFSVELSPAAFSTDVAAFEQGLRLAAQARGEGERLQRLAQAADLYAGALLPGYYEDWLLTERERLGQRFLEAVHQAEPAPGACRRAVPGPGLCAPRADARPVA